MGNASRLEDQPIDMAQRSAARTGQLLDALLDGEIDSRIVGMAARAADLPENGRYAVLVRQPANGAPPGERLDPPSTIGALRVLWRPRTECRIGIVVLGDTDVSTLAGGLPVEPGRRTGVSLAVEGLTGLFRGRLLAEFAARTITAGPGVACAENRWATVLLAARPDVAGDLCGQVLAPLFTMDRADRGVLLDTFSAWLAAGGSTHRAAPVLYCHRNTVLNRLRRLEKLTQRSLSAPKDLVELALAVEALRLYPTPRMTPDSP